MPVTEIYAKSLLRKKKKIDSWFISHYGMNIYRGCLHNCVYCDGRTEKYRVEGDFGKDIEVKMNAPELLRKELDPSRKRIPLKKSFIVIGGGVNDTYQPLESKYQLTRRVLEVIKEYQYPVHILTKSKLVKRDIDIIKEINAISKVIVSFSFSSANENISSIFEPGIHSPKERLDTMSFLKSEGISTGMFLMPVIPFITDIPDIMKDTIEKAKEAGTDYIIFGGMTLKDGRQKDYFMEIISKYFPHLMTSYDHIYYGNSWGEASSDYYKSIQNIYDSIMAGQRIPKRIPANLFKNILDVNDYVSVMLDQMDYMLKVKGLSSPYGYAAYSVSQLKEPLPKIRSKLRSLKGVGPVTEKIIREILDTGSSKVYEKLIF